MLIENVKTIALLLYYHHVPGLRGMGLGDMEFCILFICNLCIFCKSSCLSASSPLSLFFCVKKIPRILLPNPSYLINTLKNIYFQHWVFQLYMLNGRIIIHTITTFASSPHRTISFVQMGRRILQRIAYG